jgi:hypothetical protein
MKIWREMASLVANKSIPLHIRGSVYESCVRVSYIVWCRGMGIAEKIGKHLESCDSRMLRYMASVRWQERISGEEMAKRCDLKMIQDKLRHNG